MSNKNTNHEFTGRLKEAVGNKSARGFALECGVSPAAFHKYFTGQSDPSMHVLILIANTAEVGVDWLATGKGPKKGWGQFEETLTNIIIALEDKLDLEDSNIPSTSKSKLITSVLKDVLEGKLAMDDIRSRLNMIIDIAITKKG